MNKRINLFIYIVYIIGILSVSCGAYRSLDNKIYDSLLQHNSQTELKDFIVSPVTEHSYEEIGSMLTLQAAWAQVFKTLGASSSTLILDINITEPTLPQFQSLNDLNSTFITDKIFTITPVSEDFREISSINSSKDNSLLIKSLWYPEITDDTYLPIIKSYVMTKKEMAGTSTPITVSSTYPDKDGIMRRLPLFYKYEEGYIPTTAFYLACRKLGVKGSDIHLNPGHEAVLHLKDGKKLKFFIDKEGCIFVPSTFSINVIEIPYEHITDKDSAELLHAKNVIITDARLTSQKINETALSKKELLCKQELSAFNAIIQEKCYTPLPLWITILFLLAIPAIISASIFTNKKHILIFGLVTEMAVWLAINLILWFTFLTIPSVTGPLAVMSSCFISGLILLDEKQIKEHV